MADLQSLIIKGLSSDIEYCRQVQPYLQKFYFQDKSYQALYLIADRYFRKYNSCPSPEVFAVEVDKLQDVNESLYKEVITIVNDIQSQPLTNDTKWLIDSTEDWIKDRALHIAFTKALEIYKGDDTKLSKTAIPSIMSEALAAGYNNSNGHDYKEDSESQLDFYHNDVNRIKLDVEVLNDIMNGGIPRKTLTTFIAGTHSGKSLVMCSLAAGAYALGSNVLYITLEESEEKIRQRIDANLLNLTMDELIRVDKALYRKRIKQIEKKTSGILKIKEYPTKGASASTIAQLLVDYKTKHGFIPDLVCVDYMNICKSDNFHDTANTNGNLKSVSEELRAVSQSEEIHELGMAIVTGAQLNRGGNASSDPSMTDIAEGFASVFVADHVFVLTAPDELREKNLLAWLQQKNRAKNLNYKKKFVTGCDPLHMRIYDVESELQPNQDIDSMPVFDKTNTGERMHSKSNNFDDITYDLINPETGEVMQENVF
jgi:archaellum biogenesis ATPase FlaH